MGPIIIIILLISKLCHALKCFKKKRLFIFVFAIENLVRLSLLVSVSCVEIFKKRYESLILLVMIVVS